MGTQGFLSRCLKCSDKPQLNYGKSNHQKHIKILAFEMVGIIFIVILACTYPVQSFPQNTPKNGLDLTTTLVPKVISAASPILNQNDDQIKPTTSSPPKIQTETVIKCLNGNCNPKTDPKSPSVSGRKGVEQNSRKKELDSPSIKPSKIIEQHKSDDDDTNDNKNDEKVIHDVKGRKGMDPGVDVVTEKSNNVDHVDDLNNLKIQTTTKAEVIKTTTLTTTTTTSTTSRSKVTNPIPTTMSPKPKDIQLNSTSKTSLFVGIFLGGILLSVLIFVGFKRLDAIRRRREYRRMNDFLIDGMYNEM